MSLSMISKETIGNVTITAYLNSGNGRVMIEECLMRDNDVEYSEAVYVTPEFILELATKLQTQDARSKYTKEEQQYWDEQQAIGG